MGDGLYMLELEMFICEKQVKMISAYGLLHDKYICYGGEKYEQCKDFDEVFGFAEEFLSDKDDNWLTFALDAGLINQSVSIVPGASEVFQKYVTRILQMKLHLILNKLKVP